MSSAAHLTFWGELYQLSVMAQQRRQTQSHRLLKTVNQELHNHYHLDNDLFFLLQWFHASTKKKSQGHWANLISPVNSPLLINGHFLHRIMILVLMVFPACWMARLPSLYTFIMETVAYILPPLITAVMTVPVITVIDAHIHTGHSKHRIQLFSSMLIYLLRYFLKKTSQMWTS